MNKHEPAPYSTTDTAEIEEIAVLKSLLDLKYIKHAIQ